MTVEEHPGGMDLACLSDTGGRLDWSSGPAPAVSAVVTARSIARIMRLKPTRFGCQTQPQLISMVVPFDSDRLPGVLRFILVGSGDCHNGDAVVIWLAVRGRPGVESPCMSGSTSPSINSGNSTMRHNKLSLRVLLLTTVSICCGMLTTAPATAADLPVERDVKPVEVVRTNDYSEGAVVDHQGNLYISHEKIITKVAADGTATTWAATGSPNGHKILADGTHLICDASRHAVLHLNADGHFLKPAATESEGEPLRGPNDLTLDPASGGVYFTDPASSDVKSPDGSVHYLDAHRTCHTVAKGLAFPNGIVIRPGGKELLVGEVNGIAFSRFQWSCRASWVNTACSSTCPKKARARSTISPTGSPSIPRETCTSPITGCDRSRSLAPKASS